MSKENEKWVELSEDRLCGTKGSLQYKEYGLQFSGRLDSSGQPILVREATQKKVPIVNPYPGQVFFGRPVAHEPLPFVIVDTNFLKLAFERNCGHPLSAFERKNPQFCVEAIEVPDSVQGKRNAWRFSEYMGGEVLRPLDPELIQSDLPKASPEGGIRVPLEAAVRYLEEEIKLLADQLAEINPTHDSDLSAMAIENLASCEVFGEEYRRVFAEATAYREVLRDRQNFTGYADLFYVIRGMAQDAFAESKLASWKSEAELIAKAVQDPKLEKIWAQKIYYFRYKNQYLLGHLDSLKSFHAGLLEQLSKLHESSEESSALAEKQTATKPSPRPEITPNHSPLSPPTKSSRPRVKM